MQLYDPSWQGACKHLSRTRQSSLQSVVMFISQHLYSQPCQLIELLNCYLTFSLKKYLIFTAKNESWDIARMHSKATFVETFEVGQP